MFILTQPVKIPCAKKLEHSEKPHDYRESTDWLDFFSDKSVVRIEIHDIKREKRLLRQP